ncbi:aa3-type cytochrome oxidase subunit CtaJ [Rhodococcus xishaensis]|uniref:Uncharacterized protein n=1 Tax=Rhodococcus xishaensis TaxID=2487364 RepID=A0A438B3E0_9NOCA|nr:hypothetical protein [Rhodococcus xishaensis]RVW05483.1 hypothetical protein EGT50_02550 [Rhodococcus xishaensis]
MSILETALIFVGIPLLVVAIIGLLSLRGRRLANPQPAAYRLGEQWTRGPILWSATDEVTTHGHHAAHTALDADLIGGTASGKW